MECAPSSIVVCSPSSTVACSSFSVVVFYFLHCIVFTLFRYGVFFPHSLRSLLSPAPIRVRSGTKSSWMLSWALLNLMSLGTEIFNVCMERDIAFARECSNSSSILSHSKNCQAYNQTLNQNPQPAVITSSHHLHSWLLPPSLQLLLDSSLQPILLSISTTRPSSIPKN